MKTMTMFSILCYLYIVSLGCETVLVNWNFDNAAKRALVYDNATFQNPGYSADAGITGNVDAQIINTLHGPIYFSTLPWPLRTEGNYAMNSTSWTSGMGTKYWGISITTIGYYNLHISSAQRSSNTGPRDFKVQYSLDEEAWTDVPNSNITVANNFTTGVLSNVPLPEACANKPLIYLRWIMRTNVSVDLASVTDLGTSRIDDFLVIGDPITLPIELSSFTVTLDPHNHPQLTWVTQSETGVLGFYVLRADANDLSNAQVVSPLIPATNTSQQQTYVYTDADPSDNGTYYYWLQNSDFDGSSSFHGPVTVFYDSSGGVAPPDIPLKTELKGVYPNPFNPLVFIPYSLATPENVSFCIYNSRGQLVRRIDPGSHTPGEHVLQWDGTDARGQSLAGGIYCIRMQAGQDILQRKAVLLK